MLSMHSTAGNRRAIVTFYETVHFDIQHQQTRKTLLISLFAECKKIVFFFYYNGFYVTTQSVGSCLQVVM